ncbi:MAG: thiol peroxidase [Chloroflexota bacterium]
MSVRPGIAIGSNEFPVVGDMLTIGTQAPDFKLTANNWSSKSLSDYTGKVKILSIVPSLDTSVCSAQTHRFNQEASSFGQNIIVLTVSADLPYAQSRWCGAEGVERVETLSDHLDMNFSNAYGVHVKDLRICQRAAFVVDQNNVVQYAEYVPDIDDEINFAAVLSKAKSLIVST